MHVPILPQFLQTRILHIEAGEDTRAETPLQGEHELGERRFKAATAEPSIGSAEAVSFNRLDLYTWSFEDWPMSRSRSRRSCSDLDEQVAHFGWERRWPRSARNSAAPKRCAKSGETVPSSPVPGPGLPADRGDDSLEIPGPDDTVHHKGSSGRAFGRLAPPHLRRPQKIARPECRPGQKPSATWWRRRDSNPRPIDCELLWCQRRSTIDPLAPFGN